MDAWATKQAQLLKNGMDQKAVANISLDKRRNGDLNVFKSFGEPCTNQKKWTFLWRMKLSLRRQKQKNSISKLYMLEIHLYCS